jgi:hypothetical protein
MSLKPTMRFSLSLIVLCFLAVPACLGAGGWSAAGIEAQGKPPAEPPAEALAETPSEAIDRFAAPFLGHQGSDGAYEVGPEVQCHLKAEIAMGLATEATGDRVYAESALRDLRWVIANRLEENGGLNWRGPADPFFFEVHQHWFLIASELIRRAVGLDDEIRPMQRRVWRYLLGNNPARADFYFHNRDHHGPAFGYRSVDRSGVFQSQAAFKGSYEVGAALWSLALHRDSTWLDAGSDSGAATRSAWVEADGAATHGSLAPMKATTRDYLAAMAAQVSLSTRAMGFVDPKGGLWARSILWSGDGWSGWEPHDWKYSLHMQEGALLYQVLTGKMVLCETVLAESENLIRAVEADGSIPSIPDNKGSPAYEYGEALSVLGLSAIAFDSTDASLANRSLEAGRKVARTVIERFEPGSSEECAILLIGLCRITEAETPRNRFAPRFE